MADVDVVVVLRGQLAQARDQVQRLEAAIRALEGAGLGEAAVGRHGGRTVGRKGARRRKRGPGQPRQTGVTLGNDGPHGAVLKARHRRKGYKLSEETRAKMRAAQQARWASKKK